MSILCSSSLRMWWFTSSLFYIFAFWTAGWIKFTLNLGYSFSQLLWHNCQKKIKIIKLLRRWDPFLFNCITIVWANCQNLFNRRVHLRNLVVSVLYFFLRLYPHVVLTVNLYNMEVCFHGLMDRTIILWLCTGNKQVLVGPGVPCGVWGGALRSLWLDLLLLRCWMSR